MPEESTAPPSRRSARAILLDDEGRLILIKRTRPGQAPYWTTPGGGVEQTDASLEEALRRELDEELGAEVASVSPVFVSTTPRSPGTAVEHIFAARLTRLDEAARHGPEVDDPSRGTYEIQRVELLADDLAAIDLRPTALKEFVLANRHDLILAVGIRPPGYGSGELEIRPRAGSRRRIVVTPTEIAVYGTLRRRRRDRAGAARVVRATLPGRGLAAYEALFVLDGAGDVIVRINANGYDRGDLNRLIGFVGLPCDRPDQQVVTPNQLSALHPGLVRWHEAHPLRAALYLTVGILAAAGVLSVALLV